MDQDSVLRKYWLQKGERGGRRGGNEEGKRWEVRMLLKDIKDVQYNLKFSNLKYKVFSLFHDVFC